MVLLLAVHTLETVTSMVPFSVIQLSELYKNKEIPGELRLDRYEMGDGCAAP